MTEHWYELPIDDPRHREMRDEAWLGGPLHEGRYYLSRFLHSNEFRASHEEYQLHLRETIQRELPQSLWLLKTCVRDEFMIIWLKAKYRQSKENERYPIRKETKEDRAIVLLLENPTLSDEDIQLQVKATPKTMQRWSTYFYVRREMRLVAEGLRKDS